MEFYLNCYIIGLLIIIAYKDFCTSTIANTYVGYLGMGTVLFYLLQGRYQGGLVAFGIISTGLLLLFFTTQTIGGGDVKLIMALCWWLGWHSFIFLYLAVVLGAICGLGLGLIKRRRRIYFPFGPILAISAIVVHFQGSNLLAWWWQLCG